MHLVDQVYIDYPLCLPDHIFYEYRELIHQAMKTDGFITHDLKGKHKHYYISNDGHIYSDHFNFFSKEKNEISREKIYFHGHITVECNVYINDINLEEWHGFHIRMHSENYKKNYFTVKFDLKFTDGLLVKETFLGPTKEEIDELHASL